MRIEDEVYLDEYGMRRKRFIYDRRVHHSYVFVAGQEVYTVIMGSLKDESMFVGTGYRMPEGTPFPANGMAEVYFDIFDGTRESAGFRHVKFAGLGSAVVLQKVSLALAAHYEKFDIGGFVFQAATGGAVDIDRKIPLEETYDYLLGLKNEPRYNKLTGQVKKTPRSMASSRLRAHKFITEGRACYVVLP
ncbi:hypothetical protein EGM70_15380 [Enterobacteriaceae bacterium 89]|nr:hypothetical protein [Enterobacteriaceae bacterium 89]